jgi:hypothetical protein
LWDIARSTNIQKWQHHLDKMKVASQQAYDWVEELVPNTWIKAFFSEFPKCDILLNNHLKFSTGIITMHMVLFILFYQVNL